MSVAPAPRLFCFGLGFSALALCDLLRMRGFRLAGTCRSAAKQQVLKAAGIEAFLFDGDRPLADAGAALAGTTHLLSSVPPSAAGDPVLAAHGADIAGLPGLRWLGYLSTTGVYGDHGGGWVDEATPLTPSGPRGARRLAAETGWRDLWHRHGLPVHVFRLAAIYGPGRSPLDQVRAGSARRIDKPGQVFSRIHVADIAQVLAASIDRPRPGAAYNVCDDEPAPPAEVVAEACRLLGVAPPPLVPYAAAELSALGRSFYAENKRVDNALIKRELGVRLAYPSYRDGLAALARAAAERNSAADLPA